MNQQHAQITRQQAKEALLRSGYLLETRLESILRNEDISVETNAAYPDPKTGISRELDLHARIATSVNGDNYGDRVYGVLLIECINNANPIACFTKEGREASYIDKYKIRLSGIPVKMPTKANPNAWVSLVDHVNMAAYHHYCSGKISTQWCSFTNKSKDFKNPQWIAWHDHQHFTDFSKIPAAIDYYVRKGFVMASGYVKPTINLEMLYPVLVVQGELLEVKPSRRSVRLARTNHIQFRRTLAAQSDCRDYYIDVLTERFFPTFIQIVKQEIDTTAQLISKDEGVRDAVKTIWESVHGKVLKHEEIRRLMKL